MTAWLQVRVAEPVQQERVKSLDVGFLRRKLGVAAVKVQCLRLFGRLDSMGPAAVTGAGRRRKALD